MHTKRQVITETGGLGLLGLGFTNFGKMAKKNLDNRMDYSPSLLVHRHKHEPMPNKAEEFKKVDFHTWSYPGLIWSTLHYQNYFNDEASYQFDPVAMKQIAEASYELHNMCLEVVDNVVKSEELMDLFEIPLAMRDQVRESWKKNEADLINRFDFLIDGVNPPKLLEYNADTPMLICESAHAQALWGKHNNVVNKQFNFLTNALKHAWKAILGDVKEVTFAGRKKANIEEFTQLRLLQSTLPEGVTSSLYDFGSLFYNEEKGTICASENPDRSNPKEVNWLWKLYAWEWLCFEEIGKYFKNEAKNENAPRVGEPAWKLIIANKALLPYLWQLYPNHPNLLPAYFTDDHYIDEFLKNPENLKKRWVGKSKFGRTGENILLSHKFPSFEAFIEEAKKEPKVPTNDKKTKFLGKHVLQEFYPTPHFNGRRITVTSWIIFGAPAGIGVREDINDIACDTSCFVPSYVDRVNSNTYPEDDEIELILSPSTKNQEEIRNRLYGKSGEELLNNLYSSRNEYMGSQPDQEQTGFTYRRGFGNDNGGYCGWHNAVDSTEQRVKTRQGFEEKMKESAKRKAMHIFGKAQVSIA